MSITSNPGFIRFLRAASILLALVAGDAAQADSANEINASANAALADFRKSVAGADDYLAAAKGVLVIPEVKKVGLVVGGQWGEGVLRVNNKTVAYYRMTAGSVGFQAGFQKANYLFIFLTDEALQNFRASQGWDVGLDAGITLVDQSIGTSIDTLKAKSSVVAFIYGKEGLMGGYSLKGQNLSKFTPK